MPLIFIAAAFLAGVYVASLGQVAPVVEVGGLGIGIIGLIASRWTPRIRLPSLIVLAVLGGSWRYDSALQANVPSLALSAKVGQGQVELRGVVDTSPETGELRQNVRLRLTSILGDRGWAEVHGTALLFAALAPEFAYGESLEVSGKLEDPPVFEDFDYRGYLALQGINYVMQRPAISIAGQGQGFPPMALMYGLRRRFADVLGSTLPEPEASIAQGVLLGTRSAIPRRVLNDFAATGTTHILAISGYNITLIAAAIMVLATRVVGRHRASYVAALGIGLYAILAGASPSVLRATVMGLLVIVAYRLGRQNVVINALAVSAAGLLVVQPFWLWDAGFQLSYLSTVGLVFLARPLTSVLTGAAARTGLLASSLLAKVVSLLIESVSITLAATVFTLPLAAITFRTVSLVALFANVLAVPALPPIIAGSAAVAVVGLISVSLAQLVAYGAWPFVAYLVGIVGLFAKMPGAVLSPAPLNPAPIWGCYAALAALTFALHLGRTGLTGLWLGIQSRWQLTQQFLVGSPALTLVRWAILPALVVAVVVWAIALTLPDDKLQVTFLDVGQGDAILVKTPGNRKVLVDGGPSPLRLLDQLGTSLPFWDRTIDVVVLSHPHEDHLAGLLGLLERYQVNLVIDASTDQPNSVYRSWEEEIQRKGIRREVLRPGQQLKIGMLEVVPILVPDQLAGTVAGQGNSSLVLRLIMGDVSFLLPGDTPAGDQPQLLELIDHLGSTVLKVPHHGARDALDPRFLAAVAPRLAVISVGANNTFGHPAPETLALLSDTLILRTDEKGSIQVTTDGKTLWVKTWRQR